MRVLSLDHHVDSLDWNTRLQREKIYEDPENRGLLLESVSRGMEELWKRYAPVSVSRVPLAIPYGQIKGRWKPYEGRLFYAFAEKIVVATRTWLDSMNALDTEHDVNIRTARKEICQTGKLTEVLTLLGCEEADHALYRQQNLPARPSIPSDLEREIAYYDSNPMELRALERQLAVGAELGFREIPTLKILRTRIEAAKRVQKLLSE